MKHLREDDLVLHYYGEDALDIVAVEGHLRACPQCARAYDTLVRTLNVVVPPEIAANTTNADDEFALKERIRESARLQPLPKSAVLVWLAPLLYPWSLQALFGSAEWAQTQVIGAVVLAAALLWACAGPFIAIFVLNRTSLAGRATVLTRLVVLGAVIAAISSPLYFFLLRASGSSSSAPGLALWYGILAITAVAASVPWPIFPLPPRFVGVHRLSAVVLAVFISAHIVNQALAFVSPPAYMAMRNVLRVASQQSISYGLLLGAVAIQIVTGVVMGLRHARAGALSKTLQIVSGWYLAAFLLAHVFTPLLPSRLPAPAAAFDQFHLLATSRSVVQLPFLVLGVAAFLFHVGAYARLAALTYLAEASVRRLSYAGVAVAAAVVAAVGLALCGVHL